MSANETAHLADFELAREETPAGATMYTATALKPRGTWRYIAPEMRSGVALNPSSAADMYAYGVCALLACCDEATDFEFDSEDQLQPNWQRDAAKEKGGAHLPSLLDGLLDLQQPPATSKAEALDRRLSAREVLLHPFLDTAAEREQARREAAAAADQRRAVNEEAEIARQQIEREAALAHRRLLEEAAEKRRLLQEEEETQLQKLEIIESEQRRAAALVEHERRTLAQQEAKLKQWREQQTANAGELAAKKAELEKLQAETGMAQKRLDERKRKADEQQKQIMVEQAKLTKLHAEKRRPPVYWQLKYAEKSPDGFALLPIDHHKQSGVWRALERLLETEGSQLGHGKDAQPGKPYNRLKLATAWRFEHPVLWEAYMAGQRKVVEQMKRLASGGKLRGPQQVRTLRAAQELPMHPCTEANESVLLHGAPPAAILSILATGTNERFSGSNAGTMFGDGSCAPPLL